MADTTYYVDYANGNDGNAGTSSGAAKKTLQAGVDLMTAEGDICLCTNGGGGAEPITADIDLDAYGAGGGTDGKWNRVIGVNSSFVDDGTMYEIDASGSATGGIRFGVYRWECRNIKVSGSLSYAFNFAQNRNQMFNCEVVGAGDHAIYGGSKTNLAIVNCKITGATSARACIGYTSNYCTIAYNEINGNGAAAWGIYLNGAIGTTVHGNLIYNIPNGAGQGIFVSIPNNFVLTNNTISTCAGDGVHFGSGTDRGANIMYFNRITNCGGYAINMAVASLSIYGDYNATYNNSSGKLNEVGDYIGLGHDIAMTADNYESVGTNFTPIAADEASQLAGIIGQSATNINYISAGAITPAVAGGGGGVAGISRSRIIGGL